MRLRTVTYIKLQQFRFTTVCGDQVTGFCCRFGIRLVVDNNRVAQVPGQCNTYCPADTARPSGYQCVSLAVHQFMLSNGSAFSNHSPPTTSPFVSINPHFFLWLTRATPSIKPFSSPPVKKPIKATEIPYCAGMTSSPEVLTNPHSFPTFTGAKPSRLKISASGYWGSITHSPLAFM